jgi:hypothetical protein
MRRWAWVAVASLLASCSSRPHGAADAATAGAALVGVTAIYRATTGGCWAACQNGRVCDPESGTCVEAPPCRGQCAKDERCERGVVDRCAPILMPGVLRVRDAGAAAAASVLDDSGALVVLAGD